MRQTGDGRTTFQSVCVNYLHKQQARWMIKKGHLREDFPVDGFWRFTSKLKQNFDFLSAHLRDKFIIDWFNQKNVFSYLKYFSLSENLYSILKIHFLSKFCEKIFIVEHFLAIFVIFVFYKDSDQSRLWAFLENFS